MGFERPLLSKPSEKKMIISAVRFRKITRSNYDRRFTRALLSEYEANSYTTYPLGYYKTITLSGDEQKQVLGILCEITGLTEEELKNLPGDYFPAVTGTLFLLTQ